MRKTSLLVFLLLFVFIRLNGQTTPIVDRFQQLELDLEEYAFNNPKVNSLIDISLTGTIQEFAMAFSKESKINLTIDPRIDKKVVTNFADTRPKDILLHLCKFYDLDLTFSGSIVSLIPYDSPPEKQEEKKLDISYNDYNDNLTLNLKRDTLDEVLRAISRLSGKNVISAKSISDMTVSGFVGNTKFEDALNQFALRNDILVVKDEKGFYILTDKKENTKIAETTESESKGKKGSRKKSSRKKSSKKKNNSGADIYVEIAKTTDGQKRLNIQAEKAPMMAIIHEASNTVNENYFLFNELTDPITLDLKEVTYEEFLNTMLKAPKYGYKKEKNLYLIGDGASDSFKETKIIQLQHRSVKELITSIPADVLQGLEVKEFIDLNSLIASGPVSGLENLQRFINEIDKSVPVVMIELLIVNVQNNRETRIGFEAGLADQPVQAGGQIYPSANFTFSAKAVNRLLGLLAGNGIVNIGRVSPNFYANLQAVEDNGYINVRSKPRLSTLNGQEATFSTGETRYYLRERTTLQGNQNPISLQDRTFESVNADFSIRINPIVSGDEYVTLEIEVNQSDFLGQLQTDAPPPQVNRTFNSNIRILNEEMIVLGGLENKEVSDSGTGVPFLARIPIIKWFFSNRRKAKSKSKLLIFVKPTIIY